MPSSILVTGATGFVGSHLLDRLLTGTTPVSGWYRPGGRPPDRSRAIDWYPVDLLDRAAVRDNIDRVQPTQVYHLGGAPIVGGSAGSLVPQLRTNAIGTHHVLEAVRRSNVPCRVLVVTSAQIYQPGDEPI